MAERDVIELVRELVSAPEVREAHQNAIGLAFDAGALSEESVRRLYAVVMEARNRGAMVNIGYALNGRGNGRPLTQVMESVLLSPLLSQPLVRGLAIAFCLQVLPDWQIRRLAVLAKLGDAAIISEVQSHLERHRSAIHVERLRREKSEKDVVAQVREYLNAGKVKEESTMPVDDGLDLLGGE